MNSLITIKEFIGLALTLSLAGGGFVMLLTAFDTTSPVKEMVTVHELLRDQNPGQISYISFPITEHFQKQVVSHRKSVP
ncbi:hypothetical protein [Candidatus Nitrospira neomarina]|uniref:Uncharacterized protein n=1 Tax=Candidatus Nitrospira neomarina TaxID=3020899 RepID=A0AA96GHQ5_9BACT|nr:hypothetical protein [Candidatus Nitrospira neomarina]WNM62634.1 hypothetical protein PQG83_02490 [Candidatus Nitrospira neomarina]